MIFAESHRIRDTTFADLDDAKKTIYEYSSAMNIFIKLKKSTGNYIHAVCNAHENCPFELRIGRVCGENYFCIKKYQRWHAKGELITTNKGGVPSQNNCCQ